MGSFYRDVSCLWGHELEELGQTHKKQAHYRRVKILSETFHSVESICWSTKMSNLRAGGIPFKIIADFTKGKTIALIGNGHMILNRNDGEEIDSFDIIVRMNQGSPKGKETHLGTRTDIIGITTPLMPVYPEFNPVYVICLCSDVWWRGTVRRPQLDIKIPPNIEHQVYNLDFNEHHFPLCKRLKNSWPSTGIQLLDLMVRNTEYKKFKLFGFDFCKTSSWYAANPTGPGARDLGGTHPHVHEHEKRYSGELFEEFPNIETACYE